MERKGQAAMEFLMTYGWAILAAIIVIGVLAIYFRPGAIAPESAIVTAPFYAVGSSLSPAQIQLEVQNNGGETLTVQSVNITFNSPAGAVCGNDADVYPMGAGQTNISTFPCTAGLNSGDTVNANVAVYYTRGGALVLTSTGTITGRVP